MAPRFHLSVCAAASAAALLLTLAAPASTRVPGGEQLEGRAPTPTELQPSVEAAFPRESYAPGSTAALVISNKARGLKLQLFRVGAERVVTRSDSTMRGVAVTPKRAIGSSPGRRVEVLDLDPAWLAVYLELVRRVRTDPDFKHRVEERQQAVLPVNRARIEEAQRSGEFRADLEARELGMFVNLVLNGLALQRAQGDEPPPAELVLRLLEDAIGGAATSAGARSRMRERRSAGAR